jgi:hypothetical protein
VSWDANKDPNQRAGLTVEVAHTIQPDDLNMGGLVEVYTPVENYHHLKGQLQVENSERRILGVAEAVLGNAEKTYSAKFMVRNDFL